MKVTYLGHACVNIDIDGTHFLVDPFISPNPLASHIDINTLKADYILITHAHGDHIADVEAIAKRTANYQSRNSRSLRKFRTQWSRYEPRGLSPICRWQSKNQDD